MSNLCPKCGKPILNGSVGAAQPGSPNYSQVPFKPGLGKPNATTTRSFDDNCNQGRGAAVPLWQAISYHLGKLISLSQSDALAFRSKLTAMWPAGPNQLWAQYEAQEPTEWVDGNGVKHGPYFNPIDIALTSLPDDGSVAFMCKVLTAESPLSFIARSLGIGGYLFWESQYPGSNQSVMAVFISRLSSALRLMVVNPADRQALQAKIKNRFPDPTDITPTFGQYEIAHPEMPTCHEVGCFTQAGEIFPMASLKVPAFWPWIWQALG